MLRVSINNSPTNSFKQQPIDISKKRTFVNAVDTLDLEVNDCNKRFNAVQKIGLGCICIPFALIVDSLIEKFGKSNIKKSLDLKKLPLLLGATASTMLLFGLLDKKRADGMYKSNLFAQNNAKKELSNPKLFLDISDERKENIINNPNYIYYNNKQYPIERDFFPDFRIKRHKDFLLEMNLESKNFTPTIDKPNEYSEALNQIDNKTQDYTKKIMAGMNLFSAIGSLAVGGIFLALGKITPNNKKWNRFMPALALIPFFSMAYNSSNEFINKVQMISRQKAKEDFMNDINNNKNLIQTTIEYIKTKKEYEQKLLKQDDLISIKNDILTNMDASEDEIKKAKGSQTAFFDAVKAEKRQRSIKKNLLNNSITQDLIFGSLIIPILSLLPKSFDNTKNKLGKSLSLMFALTAGVFATNAGLTLFRNK